MRPSFLQYRRWSLPSKCSFWSAAIGIPTGVLALLLPLALLDRPAPPTAEQTRLLLNAAQELRYNDEWFAAVEAAHEQKGSSIPTGRLKTQALMTLIERESRSVTADAYGEEKYIYQLTLKLQDLGAAVATLRSCSEIAAFNRNSDFTLHDIHFLNNFLFWYISPMIAQTADQSLVYALGRIGLPGKGLRIETKQKIEMKHFLHEGKPIIDYDEYLGLID